MINNVILVGRIVEEPVLRKFDREVVGAFITLAVTRPFKNIEDKYDTDFIKCSLWEGMAENTCAFCKKGDVIGVRGRLVTRQNEVMIDEEEKVSKKYYSVEVIVERVAFICSSKKYENQTSEVNNI